MPFFFFIFEFRKYMELYFFVKYDPKPAEGLMSLKMFLRVKRDRVHFQAPRPPLFL